MPYIRLMSINKVLYWQISFSIIQACYLFQQLGCWLCYGAHSFIQENYWKICKLIFGYKHIISLPALPLYRPVMPLGQTYNITPYIEVKCSQFVRFPNSLPVRIEIRIPPKFVFDFSILSRSLNPITNATWNPSNSTSDMIDP